MAKSGANTEAEGMALTWDQVNAWRLARHQLLERAPADQWLEVAARIGGLHAQVMSAAELSLWARVDGLTPADVRQALWDERTLVKTWAMRGTLHLIPTRDFTLYTAALSTRPRYHQLSWQKAYNITLEEMEMLLEGVRSVLNAQGLSREELATALAEHTGNAALRDHLLSGWGSLLKPSAFFGDLCFGPNQGRNVTFVRPADWITIGDPVDSAEALREMARRYLTAYGPALPDDFARYWGTDAAHARRVFRSLGDELAEVSVEGTRQVALAATLDGIQAADQARSARPSVRLLPNFDPYTLCIPRRTTPYLYDPAYYDRIYRVAGWISPVVLVNGHIAGVWEYNKGRATTVVTIEAFEPLSDTVQSAIAAEAERLEAFYGLPVDVEFTATPPSNP